LRPEGALGENPFQLSFRTLCALVTSQGFPRLSKPIQGVPSLSKAFSEKKRLFIFYEPSPKTNPCRRRLRFGLRQSSAAFEPKVTLSILDIHPRFNPFFLAPAMANPHRKSTASSPKSSVDLCSESLIWVEKRPATALSSGFRHSLCPITMREL
jgi:hypothetical protein